MFTPDGSVGLVNPTHCAPDTFTATIFLATRLFVLFPSSTRSDTSFLYEHNPHRLPFPLSGLTSFSNSLVRPCSRHFLPSQSLRHSESAHTNQQNLVGQNIFTSIADRYKNLKTATKIKAPKGLTWRLNKLACNSANMLILASI